MKPQNIYVVDGKRYDMSQDAVRAVEWLYSLPFYYAIVWFNATTEQDTANGIRVFEPGTIWGHRNVFEPLELLFDRTAV